MAQTQFSSTDNLTVKAWAAKLFRDTPKESFFGNLMGSDGNSLVDLQTNLEKGPGDKVTVPLIMRLKGPGVTSSQPLRGNEEQLSFYDNYVALEEYANAVIIRGVLDQQRVGFSLPENARTQLKMWGAEKLDKLMFDALFNTASDWFYLDGGASGAFARTTTEATAKAACSASYVVGPSFIQALKAWAKTGGSNRYRIPLRPVKIDGEEVYGFLCHPSALYTLKQDTTFWFPAMREAQERGKTNPIFKPAKIYWDGVAIYEHENVPSYTNGGGASVSCSKFAFLGAQALLWAWGKRPKMVGITDDYERQTGISWQMVGGTAKSVFNSLDYGSMVGYVANSNVTNV